jgi:hypothetical protein
MNVKGMIVAELNRKRVAHVEALAKLDELIHEFGGKATGTAKRGRKPGTKKRTLSPEHIAKMQAARKAKKAPATEGASLSQAAGE